jgi:uncharacterized membrane protein
MRINTIDNLRGIAFILMVFQHIFYFYDVSMNYTTSYSLINFIDLSGLISRTLFILLAGYMIGYKETSIEKRAYRSGEILLHGMLLTVLTYFLYPDYFIRFGILHFLAVGTLLVSFVAPYKIVTIIALLIILFIKVPSFNQFIDLIIGTGTPSNSMDYFPLQTWLPVLLIGLIIGQNLDLNKVGFLDFNNTITDIGKNSLNLYTTHVIILLVFYKLLNKNKI